MVDPARGAQAATFGPAQGHRGELQQERVADQRLEVDDVVLGEQVGLAFERLALVQLADLYRELAADRGGCRPRPTAR